MDSIFTFASALTTVNLLFWWQGTVLIFHLRVFCAQVYVGKGLRVQWFTVLGWRAFVLLHPVCKETVLFFSFCHTSAVHMFPKMSRVWLRTPHTQYKATVLKLPLFAVFYLYQESWCSWNLYSTIKRRLSSSLCVLMWWRHKAEDSHSSRLFQNDTLWMFSESLQPTKSLQSTWDRMVS